MPHTPATGRVNVYQTPKARFGGGSPNSLVLNRESIAYLENIPDKEINDFVHPGGMDNGQLEVFKPAIACLAFDRARTTGRGRD